MSYYNLLSKLITNGESRRGRRSFPGWLNRFLNKMRGNETLYIFPSFSRNNFIGVRKPTPITIILFHTNTYRINRFEHHQSFYSPSILRLHIHDIIWLRLMIMEADVTISHG